MMDKAGERVRKERGNVGERDREEVMKGKGGGCWEKKGCGKNAQ